MIDATQNTDVFVEASSAIKSLAMMLSKICNDLRLMGSGSRCSLQEINLPEVQPGSSIMPGKVNPVIPEVVNQVVFQVIGNDLTVNLAAEARQLELKKCLKKIKKQGYAIDEEEFKIGVNCLGVPIINNEGKAIAAISISGPVSRFNLFEMEKVKSMLIALSKDISKQLLSNM